MNTMSNVTFFFLDWFVRLLVECRYMPGTVASVGYLVKSPSLGPSIQAQGVFGVQLRIAKGQCVTHLQQESCNSEQGWKTLDYLVYIYYSLVVSEWNQVITKREITMLLDFGFWQIKLLKLWHLLALLLKMFLTNPDLMGCF